MKPQKLINKIINGLMSSAVVNEVAKVNLRKKNEDKDEMYESEEISSKTIENNEDYTSFKIIEMLKHDKFMNSIDKLNNFTDFVCNKQK